MQARLKIYCNQILSYKFSLFYWSFNVTSGDGDNHHNQSLNEFNSDVISYLEKHGYKYETEK